ncbi:piwi-like protein 1 isoform X2 [Haemaphysalis longicornis]
MDWQKLLEGSLHMLDDSPDEEAFIGCGRGGRAALLAAALRTQGRRPGHLRSDGSSGRASPSTSGAEGGTFGSSSPFSLSASSGSSAVSTPMPLGGRGFPAMQGFGAGAAPLTVLERSLLHTPAGRGALGQVQPGGPHRPPPPAQYGEPQRRPPAPPPRPPAQGAPARPERSSQPPPGRMADQSTKQYSRGKPTKQTAAPEVSYVRLGTRRGLGVFEYRADFVPEVDSKRARFDLLATEAVTAVIGRTRVFDGHRLFLPRPLRDKALRVPTALAPGGPCVVVHVQFVRQAPPAECVHLYNVLFKKLMHCLQLAQLGRNYFDRKGVVLVPQHKLEVWPGHVQSVAECEGGLLLSCDASFRVLRTITAREVLFDVYNAYPREYEARAVQAIVGSIVMTRYNYRTYRVDDIAWELKPTSTFTFHSGEQITYKDYYKNSIWVATKSLAAELSGMAAPVETGSAAQNHVGTSARFHSRRIYNLDIQDWDQPLLLHRDKPRKGAPEAEEPRLVCLVPELCTLTGLTDTMRSDFRVMKDVAGHTRVSPGQRQHALAQLVHNVRESEPARQVLDDWGLALEDASVHPRGGGRRGCR